MRDLFPHTGIRRKLSAIYYLWVAILTCVAGSCQMPSNVDASRQVTAAIIRLQDRDEYDGLPDLSDQQLRNLAVKYLHQELGEIGGNGIVLCEDVLFWHVLLEDRGFELVLSKETGDLLLTRRLPVVSGAVPVTQAVTRDQALAIATKESVAHFEKMGAADEVANYHAIPCELPRSWRIYYVDQATWRSKDWANLPNVTPPNYLIEKNTGKVVFRSFDRQQ